MLSARGRFLLILLLIVGGVVYLSFIGGWTIPLVMWSVALLLWFSHFRHGSILGVLFALQRGDIAKAESLLAQTRNPQFLSPRYRGYYYFAKGLVCFYNKDLDEGSKFLKQSLTEGLSGKQELGIVYLNLAHAAFYQQNKPEAREYLRQAKAQEVSDLHFKQRMEELELALQDANLN